jgi:hypothetical protein
MRKGRLDPDRLYKNIVKFVTCSRERHLRGRCGVKSWHPLVLWKKGWLCVTDARCGRHDRHRAVVSRNM